MPKPPFFVVTLTHATWGSALACARSLPPGTLPELRLDLFPDRDPAGLVRDLGGRCLVTCRRVSEGGHWPDADETARLERLRATVDAPLPDGTPGYFRQKLFVYERAGEPCRRCRTPIRRLTQGQRSTYFCPSCQT